MMKHGTLEAEEEGWFARLVSPEHPRLRLFCFPFAGGGTATYRSWVSLPTDVELNAVALPGREARFRETPIRRLDPLLEALSTQFRTRVGEPYALFGHSMGAIIAFELCRRLHRERMNLPQCLFVSARPAPHLVSGRPSMGALSDAEFLRDLHRRYGGVPEAILEDVELQQYFVPLLRADLEMLASYEYRQASPLPVPIVGLAGANDPEARPELVELWREQTSATFRLHLVPGGHFFINTHRDAVLRVVAGQLE